MHSLETDDDDDEDEIVMMKTKMMVWGMTGFGFPPLGRTGRQMPS
jgi:hypothetical protein